MFGVSNCFVAATRVGVRRGDDVFDTFDNFSSFSSVLLGDARVLVGVLRPGDLRGDFLGDCVVFGDFAVVFGDFDGFFGDFDVFCGDLEVVCESAVVSLTTSSSSY